MGRRRRFGRVRQLPSGRWQARYAAEDGTQQTATTTFKTKTAADRWLAEVETDLARGKWVDPRRGDLSLAHYAAQWLASRGDLRPRTRELYQWLLGKYVLPQLGDVAINVLTPARVRSWHGALLRDAPPTPTRQAYALLRAMLNNAVADEILLRNPCAIRGAGVSRHAERPVASVPQVSALAEAMPVQYRALVLTAAWSGARWGELVALTRDRLDLLHGTMTIDRQYVQLRDGTLLVTQPKTAAGIRTVHLPPHLLPELQQHLDRYVPPECPLVFPNTNGEPIRRASFQSVWVRARERAGLPGLRFHDLRHTGNTLAAATGASTKELMARMGHASMRAALIYQHATSDRDASIAAALSELAAGAAAPTSVARVIGRPAPSTGPRTAAASG